MGKTAFLHWLESQDYDITNELCRRTAWVPIVKPFLRKVAEDLNVDLNNANGNQMNTRQLGAEIIKKLKG